MTNSLAGAAFCLQRWHNRHALPASSKAEPLHSAPYNGAGLLGELQRCQDWEGMRRALRA